MKKTSLLKNYFGEIYDFNSMKVGEKLQFESKQMHLEKLNNNIIVVYSYNTIVGIINLENNTILENGYSSYSHTTSKQISQLCNRLDNFTRKHINDIRHYDNNYNLKILLSLLTIKK